jgi:glycosyltransferase involved in cell wall biosynthesis
VLLVHSSSGRYGADRQLSLIATGLDRGRYRPLVVLPEPGPLHQELLEAGVEVVLCPLAVLRREHLSIGGLAGVGRRALANARQLGRLAHERRAALVHSNTSVTLGGAAAARRAGIPHLWHVREIYSDFARAWPLYRRALSSADALACVSEATRRQFAPGSRARLVPDGIALVPHGPADRAQRQRQARAELGLPPDTPVFAVLGRLSSWKGQEVLVRALAEAPLVASGALAVLAGDAWRDREQPAHRLSALARALGVDDRVRLIGFRSPATVVYDAADVVVVPSVAPDPLPNAALEAAALGVCVVASAHGGLPEIIRHGQTGLLVAPGDHVALAQALGRLAGDPERRQRLGSAAAADVLERYSARLLLERVQGLYDQLVA